MSRTHTMHQAMTPQKVGARIDIGYRRMRMYEQPGSETCEIPRRASGRTKSKRLEMWSEFYRQDRRLESIASTYTHDWVWDTESPTLYCRRCEVVLESNGREFDPSELCEVK